MDPTLANTQAPLMERESTFISPKEKEHLRRLLNLIETNKINLGDVKRHHHLEPLRSSVSPSRRLAEVDQRHASLPATSAGMPPLPAFPQRLQTFYVEKWPEPNVKPGERTLFARHLGSAGQHTIGGAPIKLETAMALRQLVLGSTVHSFSREWRKATLAFQDLDGPYPYGIQTHRCNSRALALIVEGFMLKHLIFDREYKISIFSASSLRPNNFERRKALTDGISEMLWQAGERCRCCVALLEELPCFGHDYRYRFDNVTERMHLFEFKKFEDAQSFVKRNLEKFQSENGCGLIQILYSLVLSRTIPKIREDMGITEDSNEKLLTDTEDPTTPLLNLALTGCAVAYQHNGDILYTAKGNLLPNPRKGVPERSQIGFLFWDKGEDPDNRTEIGSMLKTPKTPIWLTKVNNMYGLLFSTNLDLVSDWRIENRFTLFYYTGLVSQPMTITLNVETRIGRPARPKTTLGRRAEEKIPPLENCIMTKWYGANVNWNGTQPFV